MAIDTEAKRRSAMAVGVLSLVVLPVADSTVDVSDRPHVCGIYAGITFAAIAENATRFDGVDGANYMVYVDLGT